MSLVLEALRKLDREKQSPERGFLVMGSGFRSDRRWGRWGIALGLSLLAVLVGAAIWLISSRAAPAAPTASGSPPPLAVVGGPSPSSTPAQPSAARADTPAGLPPQTGTVSLSEAAVSTPIPSASPSPTTPDHGAPSAPATANAAPAARPLVLTAISFQEGRPVAILNDRLVREGDSFDGVRILRIGETEVEVEIDGRRVVVSF